MNTSAEADQKGNREENEESHEVRAKWGRLATNMQYCHSLKAYKQNNMHIYWHRLLKLEIQL